MTRTESDPQSGTGRPDDHAAVGHAAVDDLLAAPPEPQLAPDRFAAMHAALVHELQQRASSDPAGRGVRLPLAAGLWRLRTTRWRIAALSGAALGVLAVALALEHVGGGAPPRTSTARSGLEAILAASWTAPYTALSGPAATAAQARCVSAFNANPIVLPHVSYSSYDHVTDSTILTAGQQGRVIVITLAAGPDMLNCFEFQADDASRSWTAYPEWSAGPGLTEGGVVVPARFAPLPKGTILLPGADMEYAPTTSAYDGTGRPLVDYATGSVAPQVAKVTIRITNSSTGATQDVSQTPNAGAYFFWWPPREGTWTKVTAYSADGRTIAGATPIPLPTSLPSGVFPQK
jgi:hypothetical protein